MVPSVSCSFLLGQVLGILAVVMLQRSGRLSLEQSIITEAYSDTEGIAILYWVIPVRWNFFIFLFFLTLITTSDRYFIAYNQPDDLWCLLERLLVWWTVGWRAGGVRRAA